MPDILNYTALPVLMIAWFVLIVGWLEWERTRR